MSDAERDRAQNALRMLAETCSAAIETLQQLPSSVESSQSTSPACAILHKDYISLLTLVYNSTTKVSLTLRAEEPAYTAALTPLRDLTTNITSLTTCATLFDPHGVTLASEARLTAKEVCEAVRALTMTIFDGNDGYLVRTGAVHDIADKARRELSTDNRAAVHKRWALDRGMLEDTLGEVASTVEGSGQGDDEDGDFDDDEWDELGLGPGKKMSAVELDRVRKIQPLFRFATLLHKRVQFDILSSKHSSEPSIEYLKTLDALPARSHDVLLASEEIVASLYAPQDPHAITSAVSLLATSVQRLRTGLMDGGLLPPAQNGENNVDALTDTMAAMNVGMRSVNGKSKEKDVRKWFDICFEQIDKLSRNLGDSLQESSNIT